MLRPVPRPIGPAAFLGLAIACIALPGLAETRAHGRVIHAIVVIDDNTSLAGLDEDATHVQMALHMGLGEDDRVETTMVRGAEVSRDGLLRAVQKADVGPDDTFLFYFTGHGATHADRGPLIALDGARNAEGERTTEVLFRSEMLPVLKAKGARLTVVLTDCCANLIPRSPSAPMPGAPGAGAPSGPTTLQMLMFEHQGVVDMTSSTYDPAKRLGEMSITTPATGSLFTAALTSLMLAPPEELDVAPRDGFVSWEELFARARADTDRAYQEFRQSYLTPDDQGRYKIGDEERAKLTAQEHQTPHAFALPARRAGASADSGPELFAANLGISYRLVPYGGQMAARLSRTPAPTTSAGSVGFEPGDLIYALDGVAIRSPEDVLGHVAQTTVAFVNVRNGQPGSIVLQLPSQAAPLPTTPYALGVFTIPVQVPAANGAMRLAVYLTSVNPGGPAQRAGLEPGDVILSADGLPTYSQADLARALGGSNGRIRLVVRNVRPPHAEAALDVVMAPAGSPVPLPASPAPAAPE